jgi:hypothetical protein
MKVDPDAKGITVSVSWLSDAAATLGFGEPVMV